MPRSPNEPARFFGLVVLLYLSFGDSAPLQMNDTKAATSAHLLPGSTAPPLQRRGVRSLGGVEAAPAGETVPLLSCDFEQGMCGFSSLGIQPWKRTNSVLGSSMPFRSDHTSGKGYYASADVMNDFALDKKGFGLASGVRELVSPTLRHTGHVCVQFAATFIDQGLPLQVRVEHGWTTEKVGEATYNSHSEDQWLVYSFSFPTQGDFRINLVAKITQWRQRTAIDDIFVFACAMEAAHTIETSTTKSVTTSTITSTPTPTTSATTTSTPKETSTATTATPGTKPTAIPTTLKAKSSWKPAHAATDTPPSRTLMATGPTVPALPASTTVLGPSSSSTAISQSPTADGTMATKPGIISGQPGTKGPGQMTSPTVPVTQKMTSSLGADQVVEVLLKMWGPPGKSVPVSGSARPLSLPALLPLLEKGHRLKKLNLNLELGVVELE